MEAASNDARNEAKAMGCDVVKEWDGTLDGDTRPRHRRLDGQIRESDEPFEVDGKTAMYPGDFGEAAEDCNCRCIALTRAKWGLDEAELETLKERAKFFELDKAKNFEEFREKYLKAEKTLQDQGNRGIIQRGNLAVPMRKLTEYALHPDKQPDKAKAFKLALGYDLTTVEELLENIFKHADESKFVEKGDHGHGMTYEFVMRLTGVDGKEANVLTAWIKAGMKKRLTSVCVTEKKVTE